MPCIRCSTVTETSRSRCSSSSRISRATDGRDDPSGRDRHRRYAQEHQARPPDGISAGRARREAVLQQWHKTLLHDAVPGLIRKWQQKLGVNVRGYFLQRMKTRWGSCNHRARHIRINTELVKKPKDLLEYVVVHEMLHLIEATHSARFIMLLSEHYPTWREARAELNELPLAAGVWRRGPSPDS